MYKKFSEDESYVLFQGTMQEVIDNEIKPNSIDCVITDPPYEIGFMNKGWDSSGVAFQKETWERCFKALKPGGYLLAFGGTRTYHRICCAIEDAGFDIRDCIMWIYGSGFPKSMSVSKGIEALQNYGNAGTRNKRKVEQNCDTEEYVQKQPNNGVMGEIKEFTRKEYVAQNDLAKRWEGWGTCLKPAYEPIIVARKPFDGSLIQNVIDNEIGALNIDGCRVPFNGDKWSPQKSGKTSRAYQSEEMTTAGGMCEANDNGRFPANVILTYDDTDKDEVCGGFPESKGANSQNNYSDGHIYRGQSMQESKTSLKGYREWYNDEGSASRYFYCAKANKKDRDEGLDKFEEIEVRALNATNPNNEEKDDVSSRFITKKKNIHTTVKPVELMEYLVRLVAPPNAVIMDCFMGSGSTGKAIMFENRERNTNYKFVGIEMTEEYLPICDARIKYAKYKYDYNSDKIEEIVETTTEQNTLF